MKRHLRRIALVTFAVICVYGWGIVTDSRVLHEELLRLHVVGASNSEADQNVKLRVRDAVLDSLKAMEQMSGSKKKQDPPPVAFNHHD